MTAARGRRDPAPVPITVLTGFLGAGKTTLLNGLLKQPALARAVVIVNEFGDVGIDHLLVDNAESDMLTLTNGCLCCAARGDLMDALQGLFDRRGVGHVSFDRILIETTGVADPGPILNTVLLDPALWGVCRADAVVTVVDALLGAAMLRTHDEARRQVAVADAVVLSKTDLLPVGPDGDRAGIERAIRVLNPAVPILEAQHIDTVLTAVLDPAPAVAGHRVASVRNGFPSDHHHLARLQATCLRAGVVQTGRLQGFLGVLRIRHGERLLRLKGLVAETDDPTRPLVVHVVRGMIHPSRRLPAWPNHDNATRIVVITEDVEASDISDLWDAFFGPPSIDRPDSAALVGPSESGIGLF